MKTKLLLRSDATFGKKFAARPRGDGASAEQQPVDREQGIIYGYAVATLGVVKDRRGEFDLLGLQQIEQLGNARSKGIKSRFTHPGMCADGFGKFLGRSRNFRLDGDIVRADLHLSQTAKKTPGGNLWNYVLDMAEEEPDMFGASVVIGWEREFKTDAKGNELRDSAGELLPPLIRVLELHASDLVDEPAANDGMFSRATDQQLVGAFSLLDQFADLSRAEVETKLHAVLDRYYTTRPNTNRGKNMTIQTKPANVTPAAVEPVKTPELSFAELQSQHAAATAELAAFKAEKLKAEKLAAAKPAEAPAKVLTEAESERDRCGQIFALCKVAKKLELAEEYINKNYSADQARADLFQKLGADLPPVGAASAPVAETPVDPDAADKAEFAKHKAKYSAMGVTEAMYLHTCRKDREQAGK